MNTLITINNLKMIFPLMVVFVIAALVFVQERSAASEKVSEFGRYQGYSETRYNGSRRLSDYLMLSDGTRLAYDLILPTKDGVPADRSLPVLFKYTPYLRTYILYDKNGKNMVADLYRWSDEEQEYVRKQARVDERGPLLDPLLRNRYLGGMLKCGYAVVVVERPGTGASFGKTNMAFEALANEANEILNWIAAQPWSDGNIGMFGNSWQGQTQLAAASAGNPHLKAIFPAATWMDNYSAIMYPGGIYNKAFINFFVWSQKILSSEVITPVDRDRDGNMLAQARRERAQAGGLSLANLMKIFPFRDSAIPNGMKIWTDAAAAYPFLERINRSGTVIYLATGWYDICTRDMILWYANLTGPKRLLIRPLDHSQIDDNQFDLDYAAEMHRWFDYWLKKIENGIMKESPIHYYLMSGEKKNAWNITDTWPLKAQELSRFYFGEGERGGTTSINNGILNPSPPIIVGEGFDAYTVDYTTTTGQNPRWTAVNWPHTYPNMRSNDSKALTYTSPPLEGSLRVVGHPIAQVWLSSDAPDLDIFAYLEEVDANGDSTYITEGNLRASHRILGQAPFENFGLPWTNHFQSELKPIPAGGPVEVVFDLLPTAYQFAAGKCIRITITCADSDNFDTPVINPAPKLRLLRDSNHPSFIQLPVARAR
jgi:putative CocE/NonD family hydrolase